MPSNSLKQNSLKPSLSTKAFFNVYLIYIYESLLPDFLHVCLVVPHEGLKNVASHGTGVADGCETPCGAGNLAQVL